VDRDVREVAEDYAAVVGGLEGGVGGREGVGFRDCLQAEALGGLRSVQGLARRDVRYYAVLHGQDRVRGRHRGADRVVLA
jgi:hypothetical protein